MIIQWLGDACFKINTKNEQKEQTIALNPIQRKKTSKINKFQADIAVITEDEKKELELRGDYFFIHNPGEYEIGGVFVYGLPIINNKQKFTGIKVFTEEISILYLAQPTLNINDDFLDKIGNVDVLVISTEVEKSEDLNKISEIVTNLDPRIVVPFSDNLSDINDFLKISGLKSEKIDRLKLTKKDLMIEDIRAIVLEN